MNAVGPEERSLAEENVGMTGRVASRASFMTSFWGSQKEADGGIIEDKATTTHGLVRGIHCSGQAVLHGRTGIFFDALAVRRGAAFPGPRMRRQNL